MLHEFVFCVGLYDTIYSDIATNTISTHNERNKEYQTATKFVQEREIIDF